MIRAREGSLQERGIGPRSCLALIALFLFATSLGSQAAERTGSPVPAPCQHIVFSPDFARDGTAFCAGSRSDLSGTQVAVFSLTEDHGRSWSQTTATGLTLDTFDAVGQLLVSPLFSDDGAVYLQTAKGLWRSADRGESFQLVYSLSLFNELGALSSYITFGPPALAEAPAFAMANQDYSGVITPPLFRPATGSPVDDHRFLIAPSDESAQQPLVISYDSSPEGPPDDNGIIPFTVRTTVFDCTPAFTCDLPLFSFPTGLFPHDAWYGADGETIYLALQGWMDDRDRVELWVSEDGGASFRRWHSVNRLLRPVSKVDGFEPGVGIAVDPAFPRRIFLRVSYGMNRVEDPPSAPPGDQIFRSDDRGRTWERVSFGWYRGQERKGGNIPWDQPNVGWTPVGKMWLQPDGRLFVIGTDLSSGYSGVYCSTNGGRTWSKRCRA